MTTTALADAALSRLDDDDLGALLFIRRFEERLLTLFAAGEIAGTTHTCLGQEYIPVALAPLLAGDFVVSNHRGHGHYLAHCGDPEGLLAEIMGREGAVCRGVGGSQHLRRPAFLSTGVQGEGLPVAVGLALSYVQADDPPSRAAVCYVGDGTWGQGAVYEALNMAGLWRVPLLVIVENNGIAQSTPTAQQLAGSIAARAAAFGLDFAHETSMDVTQIRARLRPLVDRVRRERRPLVVQFDTVRLGPHSKGDDTRPVAERESLAARDWCARYESAFAEQFQRVDAVQRARVDQVVATVRAAPPSTWDGAA